MGKLWIWACKVDTDQLFPKPFPLSSWTCFSEPLIIGQSHDGALVDGIEVVELPATFRPGTPLPYSKFHIFQSDANDQGHLGKSYVNYVVFQSLSHDWLFLTPWTAACQASLSFTISQSLLKLMSIESVMPSNHLILCCLLLLLPSIFPSIKFFSNESAFRIRWPEYWSFSFSISSSNEYSGLIP